MTDKKISELPAVVTTSLNDEIPIVQSGTTKKASLATILSSLGTTGYYLDSVPAAAIFNAPGGYFSLNGSTVSLSSLLSFSSAAKYTVGPDGNYILNSVNSPAWDWSTGRRRLLIEAISDTNYIRNPEDLSVSPTSTANCSVFVVAGGAGAVNKFSLTETANGTYAGIVQNTPLSVVNGDVVTMDVTVHPWAKTSGSLQLTGSTSGGGLSADSSAQVLWGPGSIIQSGGSLFDFSGVSAPTRFRITRVFKASETVNGIIYSSYSGSVSGRGACSVSAWQITKGYGSSYIPSGASPTARAADVVTAASGLLALLTAANAAVAIRGRHLQTTDGYCNVISSTSRVGTITINEQSHVVLLDYAYRPLVADGPGAATDFGACASWSQQERATAINGGSVASDTYSLFGPSDTGFTLANGPDGPSNALYDEIVVWPLRASSAGVQAQAHVFS
jgi:hypothetical protein